MKIRRAAIIVPPFRDFYFTRHRFSSLGAHIVRTIAARAGLDCELFNFPLLNFKGSPLPLPRDLGYLAPFLIPGETGRLSFFTALRRFGPSIEPCVSMIARFKPDICLFSVFAFCYADDAIELARSLRRRMPSVPVAAGGGGPSAYPAYFLRDSGIDYVFSGEAEVCLERFFSEINRAAPDFSSIPNLWMKKADSALPPASIRRAASGEIVVPLVKSAETSRIVTYATSLSRGCPKQCSFCSSRFSHGNGFRASSPEALAAALHDLPAGEKRSFRYKKIVVNFEDDNLLADELFMKSAVGILKNRFKTIEFIAENGIDYSFLSPLLCEWMIQNGWKKFNLSLGSIDREILSRRGRGLHLERYKSVIDLLERLAVPSVTFFICGFMEDTLETTLNNLVFLSKFKTVIGISPFYAVPGLPGFESFSRFDGVSSLLCLGSSFFPWNGSLSTKTMVTAFRLSRYINLIKSPNRSTIENDVLDCIAKRRSLCTSVKNEHGNEKIIEVPDQDTDLVNMFLREKNHFCAAVV